MYFSSKELKVHGSMCDYRHRVMSLSSSSLLWSSSSLSSSLQDRVDFAVKESVRTGDTVSTTRSFVRFLPWRFLLRPGVTTLMGKTGDGEGREGGKPPCLPFFYFDSIIYTRKKTGEYAERKKKLLRGSWPQRFKYELSDVRAKGVLSL